MKQRTASRNHLARLLLGLTLVVCMAIPSLSGPRNPRGRVGSADQSSSASLEKASLPSQVVAVGLNSVHLKKGALVNGSVVVNDPSSSPVLNDPFDLSVESNALLTGDATAASIEVKRNGEITGDVTSDNAVVANGGICDGCAGAADYVPPIFDPLPGFQSRPPGGSPLDVPSGIKTIPNATEPSRVYSNVTVGAGATLILTGGEFAFTSLSLGQNAKLLFASATQLHVNDLFDAGKESEIGPNPGSDISAKDIIIYVNGSGNPDDPNGLPFAVSIGTQSKASANFYAPNGTFTLQKTFQGVTSVLTGAVIAKNVLFDADTIVNVDSFFANQAPVAQAQSIDTLDAMIDITLSCADPENENLIFAISAEPGAGTLTDLTPIVPPLVAPRDSGVDCNVNPEDCTQGPVSSATVKYTPTTPGGEDAFTFTCTDPHGAAGMAVVSINTPDNSPPPPEVTAVDACPELPAPLVNCTAGVVEGGAVNIGLGAAGPPDSTLTFCILSLPDGTLTDSNGVDVESLPYTLPSSSLVYAAAGAAPTSDSFSFEARTGGCGGVCSSPGCDEATFTISIVEAQALAGEDQEITTELNQPVEFNVILNSGGVEKSAAAPLSIAKAAFAIPAEIAGGVADTPPLDGNGDATSTPPLIAAGVEVPLTGGLTFPAFSYVPGAGTLDTNFNSSTGDGGEQEFQFVTNGNWSAAIPRSRSLRFTMEVGEDLTLAGGTRLIRLDTGAGVFGSTECFNCGPFRDITTGTLVAPTGGSGPVLRWTLTGITFVDGGTATGWFDFNHTTNTAVDWDISVDGGSTSGSSFGGTVRTQIEFDISSLGDESAVENIVSATVSVSTEKGANDTADTFWFIGDNTGDGVLTAPDFEAAASQLNAVMPVPDVVDGTPGTFSFDVTNLVKAARGSNPPIDFLTFQGRVNESLTGFNQGLQIKTTNGASPPILDYTTPGLVAPSFIEILSVPLVTEGTIKTLAGAPVTAGATFPLTTTLVFTPALGYTGLAQVSYQVTEGAITDTAFVDFTVTFTDNCVIVGREPGCAPQ